MHLDLNVKSPNFTPKIRISIYDMIILIRDNYLKNLKLLNMNSQLPIRKSFYSRRLLFDSNINITQSSDPFLKPHLVLGQSFQLSNFCRY